jgi:ABC-type phosphate transport system ATPase subunit
VAPSTASTAVQVRTKLSQLGFYSVLRNEESDTRTGVLVEYGKTQQIFEDPVDDRTKAYVTGRMG